MEKSNLKHSQPIFMEVQHVYFMSELKVSKQNGSFFCYCADMHVV